MVKRCNWAQASLNDEDMLAYHDKQWGKAHHDEQQLFELLCMEIFQAGLSWKTVLHKQAAFEEAFHHFDLAFLAQQGDAFVAELMANPAIIRNRMKIQACLKNARLLVEWHAQGRQLNDFLWSFTDGEIQSQVNLPGETLPAKSELSERVTKGFKQAGFSFIGPVIMQSYLEATGVLNNHQVDCDFK
ncbi:DNA-3-methyladenine glycosylase I [Eupransor demetentiae]|uniref:3-methyladenine DNA glycosylase Tag (Tag) n=1 Tax=Eupransor demetentiae TaxID=3109584 RepID=A0ABM9N6C5_9LACO|nr:3-methyladenine DNA glycosylase Tag (Tag) [Lactobacillaceae bacterium LMG 33000]